MSEYSDPLLVSFHSEAKCRNYFSVVVRKQVKKKKICGVFSLNEIINNATKIYSSCHLRLHFLLITLIPSKLWVCMLLHA